MSPTISTGLCRHRGRSQETGRLSSVYFALFPPEKLNLRNRRSATKGLEAKRPSKLNESQGGDKTARVPLSSAQFALSWPVSQPFRNRLLFPGLTC